MVYLYRDNEFLGVGYQKESYLDDPINITDTDYHKMLSEVSDNDRLIKHVKKGIKEDVDKLRTLEFKAVPYLASSGLEANKQALKLSEDEFFNKMSDEKSERPVPTNQNAISNDHLLDVYPRYRKKEVNYKNIIIDDK